MKTKIFSTTIAFALFASVISASAQCYGYGYPITPMGIAIQAQTIALQQATAQMMSQIASQTVTPMGYIPVVPAMPVYSSVDYSATDMPSADYSSSYTQKSDNSSTRSHAINCASCANSGRCKYCNGDGYARKGGLGLQTRDTSRPCPICGGTGVCQICHGNHK